MTGNDKEQSIAGFWRMFRKHASDLASADGPHDQVYDRLLAKLQEIAPGLYLEFSTEPRECELIITADGDRSLFPLVHTIVSEAPYIPGRKIIALKPKLGFPVTSQWEDVTIRIADVVFDPLERKGSNDLGLRIYVPGLRPEYAQDAHNAILRAVDHGLGERGFAEAVQYTEVLSLPAGASKDDFIPLVKLEQYIQWRKKKMKEKPGQ